MRKILITGGAGFIGSNLSNRLTELGYEVTVIDNLNKQIHGEDAESESILFKGIKGRVKFILGCITNPDLLYSAIADNEVIIHLAAETGTGQSMYNVHEYTKTNVMGTSTLLDLLRNKKHKVCKVVVASSRAIYGEGKYLSNGVVYFPKSRDEIDLSNGRFECLDIFKRQLECIATDEDSKIHPLSVYGITKQVQEQLVMCICPNIGISSTALRFQNVYGPGQSMRNPYTGIISIFTNQIRNKNNINLFEDGLESRDFVYIDDVIDSILLSIEDTKAKNEIFNVGSGVRTTVIDVANLLIKKLNANVCINISGEYRVGDIRHNYSDNSKINRLLNYSPKYSLEQGIDRFVEWAVNEPAEIDKFSISMDELKNKNLIRQSNG